MLSFRSYVLDHTDENLKVYRLGWLRCCSYGHTCRMIYLIIFQGHTLRIILDFWCSLSGCRVRVILKVLLLGSYWCYSWCYSFRVIQMPPSNVLRREVSEVRFSKSCPVGFQRCYFLTSCWLSILLSLDIESLSHKILNLGGSSDGSCIL
jgi:hypothetical protein